MRHFAAYKLRNIRLKKGYSLEMTTRLMASRIKRKFTRSAVSHWEKGNSKPSMETVIALAEVFEVKPDYFFVERPNCLLDDDDLDPILVGPEDDVKPAAAVPLVEGGGGSR